MREFFLGNPIYWMEEFHFDGFRLDAIHAILDDSDRHILADIAAAIHERGGFVFAEDERNAAFLADPGSRRRHAGWTACGRTISTTRVRVALTGEQESYLKNFTGSAEELADTLAHGWHYRGQPTPNCTASRAARACAHLPPHAFCYCISNHDQVGNRAFGERLTAACSPEAYRAASALLCLAPYTPLIFQGQEWAASTPFLYFTDHNEELGRLVTEGRRKEFKGFAAFADEDEHHAHPRSAGGIDVPAVQAQLGRDAARARHAARAARSTARRCGCGARNRRLRAPRDRDDWQASHLAARTVVV